MAGVTMKGYPQPALTSSATFFDGDMLLSLFAFSQGLYVLGMAGYAVCNGQVFRLGIWDDASPYSCLAYTGELGGTTARQWHMAQFSSPVYLPAGSYYLGGVFGPSDEGLTLYRGALAQTTYFDSGYTYSSSGALPSWDGSYDATSSYAYDVYAWCAAYPSTPTISTVQHDTHIDVTW